MAIAPEIDFWTAPSVRSKVDLPMPLTPTIAASSPLFKAKEMS